MTNHPAYSPRHTSLSFHHSVYNCCMLHEGLDTISLQPTPAVHIQGSHQVLLDATPPGKLLMVCPACTLPLLPYYMQICPDRQKGEWLSVPPIAGAYICNIGDLLERWTNGCYRSTLHRVVNTTGQERYSIPFFLEPNFDCVVEPLPQVRAGADGRVLVG